MNKIIFALVLVTICTLNTRAEIILTGTTSYSNANLKDTNTVTQIALNAANKTTLSALADNTGIRLSFDVKFGTTGTTMSGVSSDLTYPEHGFSFGFINDSSSIAYGWLQMETGQDAEVAFHQRGSNNMTHAVGGTTPVYKLNSDTLFTDAIIGGATYHIDYSVIKIDTNQYQLTFDNYLDGNLIDSHSVTTSLAYQNNEIIKLGFRSFSAPFIATALTNIKFYTLEQIPEPATYALLGLGTLTLVLLRRRRSS